MSANPNAGPVSLGCGTKRMVWFTGSTAVLEGMGFCYNWDHGTAASADYQRMNEVELPSITNARFFAGVAAQGKAACTGGQFIEIYEPGSTCNILSQTSTTIGVGILTCNAGGTYAGYWKYAGFEGEGSAVPLQTVDRSSTAGVCLAKLQVGQPSGLLECLTCTAGGATTMMVGGVTAFETATPASDATFTVADGTIAGLKKKFVVKGTQTTNNIVITINGIRVDGSTALVTDTMDTTNEEITLAWNGDWYCTGISGGTVA